MNARRPNTEHHVFEETERLTARYLGMLRSGLGEASSAVDVRRIVVIGAVLFGLSAYDEYFPLVARDHDVSTQTVPILVGITVVGQVIGTALAGRTSQMSARAIGAAVMLGGALISVGALVTPYAGFVAIGFGYGLLSNTMIVAEARLQQAIVGPARATVTSVLGVASEVFAVVVYVAFVAASGVLSVPTLVALLGVPILGVAWCVARWFPAARDRRGFSGSETAEII
jgi:hypothetical protein